MQQPSNISCVVRKTEPLGIKFKTICCVLPRIILYLEIQHNKVCIQEQQHYHKYGATTRCLLRIHDAKSIVIKSCTMMKVKKPSTWVRLVHTYLRSTTCMLKIVSLDQSRSVKTWFWKVLTQFIVSKMSPEVFQKILLKMQWRIDLLVLVWFWRH